MKKGSALITLLIFTAVCLTIVSSAVAISVSNSLGATEFSNGRESYYVAEAGIETALAQLQRTRTYTGETLTLPNGSAAITVTGSGPYTIISIGTANTNKRTIQITTTLTDSSFAIITWKEI